MEKNETKEKLTGKSEALRLLKVFGVAIGGAVVGSIPQAVALCEFNIFTVALYILSGALAMVAYGLAFKKPMRRGYDHPVIILASAVGVYLVNFFEYMIRYAPAVVIEGSDYSNFELTVRAFFTHPVFDSISTQGLITTDNTFSVYTWYFSAVIFAIIGIYIAFLFVIATDREETKGKKKR